MEGYRYLFAKLGEISEPQILELLRELELVTRLQKQASANWSLFNYLTQCLYPNGDNKEVKIEIDDLDEHDVTNAFLLRKKIRNLSDSEIYVLCQETARHFNQGLEPLEGMSLYLFINKFFTVLKKKKPSRGNRRWLHS